MLNSRRINFNPDIIKVSLKKNLSVFSALVLSATLSGCNSLPWIKSQAPQTPAPALHSESPPVTSSQKVSKHSIETVQQRADNPTDKLADKLADSTVNEIQNTEKTSNATVEPDNIWPRLIAGYRLHKPYNKRFAREYNWYRNHPEYLARVQERAEPYLHLILEEAEKRNMPTELVLLPVVESAFQPFAYSPGRAAGLWQFIPSTGRHFGLEQTWWYDGRRDVMASTRAALDYLQSLSKQFDGDWELALASYNAGAGNVRRAIRKNKKKNKPTDYWSLKLPRETMTYVPRLLAASQVFADAAELDIALHEIPNRPQLAVVKVDHQIDLARAAEMADISIEELYQLNPAFNRWATSPGKASELLVPIARKPGFEEKLAQLKPSELVQWQRYKIRKGDVLGKIAKRHHTTVDIIKDVNKLKNHRIRAGKYLLIPVASKNSEAYKMTVSQRLKKQQSIKRSGNRINYIVQAGDTLWDISRKHSISHKKIARWNGMAPGDTLRPGQKLVIWKKKAASNSVALADSLANSMASSLPGSPANRTTQIRYTIRKGDSLSRIANRFNVSVNDLKKWNRLNQRYLQPGQTLKLKVNITEQL